MKSFDDFMKSIPDNEYEKLQQDVNAIVEETSGAGNKFFVASLAF